MLTHLFSPQSLCVALPPGLAVSVLKAIFQEVHVQVSEDGHFYILCLPALTYMIRIR